MLIEPAKATGSVIPPLCGCADFCSFVRNELISETVATIFLKLGMKLGDNKGNKNSTARFLLKIFIWPILAKRAKNGQNPSFWGFTKNDSNKFFKIALKISPKIGLQDRIVILPE